MAEPVSMTADKLLDICASMDVRIASQRGDALGWHKLTVEETEDWISTYITYDAQSVEMVGWQNNEGGQRESLLFWATTRSNGLKTCSYSSSNVGDLLDNLTERLGSPHSLARDDTKKNITARWVQNDVEYSFVQLRSSVIVTIGPAR